MASVITLIQGESYIASQRGNSWICLPEHITPKSLKTGLPADWEEQKKFLRIE